MNTFAQDTGSDPAAPPAEEPTALDLLLAELGTANTLVAELLATDTVGKDREKLGRVAAALEKLGGHAQSVQRDYRPPIKIDHYDGHY